jgi:hypothetical protein
MEFSPSDSFWLESRVAESFQVALRRHCEAIQPEYERRGFRADPVRFRAMLDLVAPPAA